MMGYTRDGMSTASLSITGAYVAGWLYHKYVYLFTYRFTPRFSLSAHHVHLLCIDLLIYFGGGSNTNHNN